MVLKSNIGGKSYIKIESIGKGLYSVKTKNYPVKIPHEYTYIKNGKKHINYNYSNTCIQYYSRYELKYLGLTDSEIEKIDNGKYHNGLAARFSQYLFDVKKYNPYDIFMKFANLKTVLN